MRNEGPAQLYSNRKQLVVVVTYRSSVTLPVWAVSHPPAPLSKPHHTPNSSISILTCLLLTVFQAFSASSTDPASSFLSPSPPPSLHLALTTPTSPNSALLLSCERTRLSTSGPAHYFLLCAQSIPPQRSDTKSFWMAVQSKGLQTRKSE